MECCTSRHTSANERNPDLIKTSLSTLARPHCDPACSVFAAGVPCCVLVTLTGRVGFLHRTWRSYTWIES
jgi:hypothetical protein